MKEWRIPDPADPKPELKKVYKTVLPLCEECENDGKKPIVARQYGSLWWLSMFH
jgi:hypothetical protein